MDVGVGSLLSFRGLRFGGASFGTSLGVSLAGAGVDLAAVVVAGVEDFLVASFSRTTPPAEPARPAVAESGFAALRERGCLADAVDAGLGPGDCVFEDIVKLQGDLFARYRVRCC